MQLDALAVRLRPRSPLEAADLGVRLCQSSARSVYSCYAMVALPVLVLALASFEIAGWLPGLVIWCAKPWLDRTILFVLSRAAFGKATTPSDVWKAQRRVWWRQFLFTWTVRRLSLWRSLTEPVYQLEEFSIGKAHSRIRRIRQRNAGSAAMMTSAFSLSETALSIAVFSLLFWLAPSGHTLDLEALVAGELPTFVGLVFPLSYAVTVFFLEPFYVASGFAMYLNRRAELEAWDIEQEFRRAFAPDRIIPLVTAVFLLFASLSLHADGAPQTPGRSVSAAPSRAEIERALETVKADPNLATERTIKTLRWKSSTDTKPSRTPAWFKWIAGLFAWFEQSARVLVWCTALALAGLLVVYLSRIVRSRSVSEREEPFVVPTHVRDLDIRPQTLPEDIGAAARELWDRGEHRSSLALLYRGMLSRLAHVHGVPIRDSSTEGDCLTLAASRLPQDRCEYLSRLVRVWQRFGYGREEVHAATVYVLCDDFASALRPVPALDSVATEGAA